jgi:predicted ATP-grasp superfamily ATP-dependent carboligase
MQNSLKNNGASSSNGVRAFEQSGSSTQFERRKETYDALVLDANLRQSLVSIRSLGSRGKRIAALETKAFFRKSKYVPAFSSRWCQHGYVAPSYEQQAEPFLDYLLSLLEHTGARVLITSSDGTLAFVREHRADIEKYVRIALAKESALEAAINKDQTLEIAGRLGLGVPKGVIVKSVSEVSEAIRDIGLPAVIKPIETWLWGEEQGVRLIAALVTTPDEARAAVENLTQLGGATLFQQFLTGRREAISLLYAKGEFYARFAQWAKRTQPPLGGTSVLRQSIAVPDDIGDQSERLVREIELEGYSEVEFRRDHLGKPYLMEINPRLSASVEVAVRAGVDFPYLLYQWANEERIDRVEGYKAGGWMRYLEGDLLTTIQAIIERGRPGIDAPSQVISDFFTSFFMSTGYDYIDRRDLLPALTAAQDFVYRVQQKATGRAPRRK